MNPTQYIGLLHTPSAFPIHAHFADSESKKRWGNDGPRVAIGSTITFGGFMERIMRERDIDRTLSFVQIEVTNIAYLSNLSNNPSSPTRAFYFSFKNFHLIFFL